MTKNCEEYTLENISYRASPPTHKAQLNSLGFDRKNKDESSIGAV